MLLIVIGQKKFEMKVSIMTLEIVNVAHFYPLTEILFNKCRAIILNMRYMATFCKVEGISIKSANGILMSNIDIISDFICHFKI